MDVTQDVLNGRQSISALTSSSSVNASCSETIRGTPMSTLKQHSHSGWDKYYQEQIGKRAWNGIPDQYLTDRFDEILIKGAQTVIDIAAGDGRNTEPFLDRGLSVVATDLSDSALKNFNVRCLQDKRQQPILIAGDFLNLGLLEGQFDCAVCFNSIPHFESPSACLNTI